MQNISEYEQKAIAFLESAGLEFRAVLVGSDCPLHCPDAESGKDMDKVDVFPRKTHIHGKHYRCTISGAGRAPLSIDFWNSYRDEEENFFVFGAHESLTNRIVGRENCYWDKEENFFVFGAHESLTNRIVGRENCYWDKYRIGGKYSSGPKLKKKHVPNAYILLACVIKNDPGTFHNFCADYGYDTDSRKAESTYQAVRKEWEKISRFFTASELTQLQEIS